jgi:hypothetical protein
MLVYFHHCFFQHLRVLLKLLYKVANMALTSAIFLGHVLLGMLSNDDVVQQAKLGAVVERVPFFRFSLVRLNALVMLLLKLRSMLMHFPCKLLGGLQILISC